MSLSHISEYFFMMQSWKESHSVRRMNSFKILGTDCQIVITISRERMVPLSRTKTGHKSLQTFASITNLIFYLNIIIILIDKF